MGGMRLGVVSDTHGHVPYALPAVAILERERVDMVVHCGDIGSPQIIALFARWPTHFVFGNCDYEADLLRGAMRDAGQTCHERFGELELEGRRIAFLHGDDLDRFRTAITCGTYDLVCYGHTHVAAWQQSGPTRLLNPGALYRAQPHSLAIVQLPDLQVRHIEVPHA